MKIAVVGGGITGLAAAYRLQTLLPGAAITLFERESRLGGKLLTEHVDGFVMEGGADSFLSRKPGGVGLSQELGLKKRLVGRDTRHQQTFVRHQGRLHPLPEGLLGFVPTRLEALEPSELLTAEGKMRLAREPEIPVRESDGDESVAAFMTRRLGQEAYENLIEPLMSGIYAGDSTQLSLAATYPRLRQLEQEHGSLLRGLLATHSSTPLTYPPFVSFPNGMGELVVDLAKRLRRIHITAGVEVTQLTTYESRYQLALDNGAIETADAVILATPAHSTAKVVAVLDPVLAQAHAGIPYASSVIINLAYRVADLPRPLEGYGYVIPRTEATEVLACTWSSNKWAGRAPENTVLLRVCLGRYGSRDVTRLTDDTLLQLARAELSQTLGLDAMPLLYRLYRWPLAIPQHTLSHLERVETIEKQLTHHPGLFMAGAAYRGVGIPDCIVAGEAAAERVANFAVGSEAAGNR
jgi:oxygen-dependent protoporphyrinogen oxidase